MNIDAIQTLIDISEQEELVEAARAELAAMETENAAMSEALEKIANFDHSEDCDCKSCPIYECGCYEESQWEIAKAALSPDHIREATKKVLVDAEKLREVYVAFNAFLGVDPGVYPVVLDWLAEILKAA